jgi:hypothetical protein
MRLAFAEASLCETLREAWRLLAGRPLSRDLIYMNYIN